MSDTIAAIASGMTASGIGIVRISGPEAFPYLAKIFHPAKKDRVSEWAANTIHYGHIFDGEECIDECLVLAMRAPHTYTTEDTIEIDCHGGPFVMKRILETVLKAGARLADPGEFTRRAFLGGRIDLSEAEAVMDVISARNEDALTSSLSQLSGSIKRKISSMRSVILDEMSYIEAALDDPEHMDLTGYPPKLREKVEKCAEETEKLIESYTEGKYIKEGIRTVILGKPNAGKSSLLNALTGEDRAIVTEIEGTTRDVLEENVNLGGVTLRLFDTAGIRENEKADAIEKIGISRAKDTAKEADLILTVLDAARPLDTNDLEILDLIEGRRAIVLLNKTDLPPVLREEEIRKKCTCPVLLISASTGAGIKELGQNIRSMFLSGHIRMNEEVTITNVRQKEALERAKNSLILVRESIDAGMSEDFYTIDLMDAYKSLGEILGEEVDDDLVNNIFAKFCMGK